MQFGPFTVVTQLQSDLDADVTVRELALSYAPVRHALCFRHLEFVASGISGLGMNLPSSSRATWTRMSLCGSLPSPTLR